jgi:hypothetical protein
VSLEANQSNSLRILVGEKAEQATAWIRLGLHGANQAYSKVELNVKINDHELHKGEVCKTMIVTTGLRHGIASCPATEAYAQWPVPLKHLKQGWNEVTVTLTASPKPLKLVETEIAVEDSAL